MEDKRKTLLWLDDYRNPFDAEINWLVFSPLPLDNLHVVWVRTYQQFCATIEQDGVPDAVCLDHDLGEESEGYSGFDAAKFLVNYCIDYRKPIPLFNSQSANPVGRENILSYLKQAKEIINVF